MSVTFLQGATALAVFAASFLFVGLKALQQLNVVHDNYLAIMPTSLAMATCEVLVIANMAHYGWGWIILPVGAGSGLGALSAMWLHRRLR